MDPTSDLPPPRPVRRASVSPRPRRIQPLSDDLPDVIPDPLTEEFPPLPRVPPLKQEEVPEESEGGGAWFVLMAIILSIGVLAGGFYLLRRIVDRGYLDQFTYAFQEINLLPGKDFRPTSPESSLQVFLTEDGMTLTPHLSRLKRNAPGPEKDHLILQELFTPRKGLLARPAAPDGTRVRGFYRLGRTAYLDLTEEFVHPAQPTPHGERLAVYATINSILLNNSDLDAVQLLIEGKPIETAWGWLDCSSPLGADLSLIR